MHNIDLDDLFSIYLVYTVETILLPKEAVHAADA